MVRPDLARAALETLLGEVRRVFADACIPLLPVKGIVTGKLLYAPDERRPLADIDLRIRSSDLERARELAQMAKLRVVSSSRAYRNLVLDMKGVDLDVETACGPPGYIDLPIEDMLARSFVPEGSARSLGAVPEWHDHALLMVANLVKDHVYGATSWAVEDLRRMIRLKEVSVATLIARAEETKARALLRIVARFLDVEPLWAEVREQLDQADRAAGLRADLWLALFRQGRPAPLVRIGARVVGSGWIRPVISLARAGWYEAERLSARARRP